MIRLFCMLSTAWLLSGCKDDVPTATQQTSAAGHSYTLITLPDHDYISVQVAWGTDWPYRRDTNKAAPFIGADLILAGGADGYPAGDVTERMADMDSDGVIYVAANDHVIGELTFSPEHMTETIQIAHAHLLSPTLESVWFDRISTGFAQQITEVQAHPAGAGFGAARWAIFGEQPLRTTLSLDDSATFASLTQADVAAWHQETFTRTPEAIVIAGDITPSAAGPAIDALLSGLPAASRPLARAATADFTPRRILLHQPDTQVTQLTFIAPLPPTRHGSEMEDLILSHALGGDDQGVLFEAVRTALRASYGFYAGMDHFTREHRFLYMTGEVETAKLAQAEKVVRDAYARFAAQGPQGPISNRKAVFEQHFNELPDYVVDVARAELQSAVDGYAHGRSLELSAELAAVTQSSLTARLTADFPPPDAFLVIAVTPDATALPGACIITSPHQAADCP